MIDLHIHTQYSDGTNSAKEILQKAEELKLECISITDHDTCKAYEELKNIDVSKFYSGKIIYGIEIKSMYKERSLDVLGYKIDINKMQEKMNAFYKERTKEMIEQKYFDILYNACKKLNLKVREKEEIKWHSIWGSLAIYDEIKSHEENKELLPQDLWNDFKTFTKKYCVDKNSAFYIDKKGDYPSLEQTIQMIKDCGGLVFLPHLFLYDWAKDKEEFINDLLDNYDIDGIECSHSSFTEEQVEYLKNICSKKGYFMSAGSDYHGENKKDVFLGQFPKKEEININTIKNWI